jgi:hypothetical protein
MNAAWYNYKTQDYDYLAGLPENPLDYLPQVPAATALYELHLKMGKDKATAMILILEAYLGEKVINAITART